MYCEKMNNLSSQYLSICSMFYSFFMKKVYVFFKYIRTHLFQQNFTECIWFYTRNYHQSWSVYCESETFILEKRIKCIFSTFFQQYYCY